MENVSKRPFRFMMLLFFAGFLILSGCSSSDSENNQDTNGKTSEQENETTNESVNNQQDGDNNDDAVQDPEVLDPEVSVKIGYPTQGASMLPLWVAQDLGFFEKYGIDAEAVYIAGTPKVQEVLNGGGIEAGLLGVDAVGKAKSAGHDSLIIASVADKVAMYVYGTDDLNEDSLQDDLKGETVITAAEGSLYDYLAKEFTTTTGLSNDDVDYLNMGGEGDRTAAFVNGEGKAIVISPPTSFKLDDMGYQKIFDFSDLDVLLAGLGMTTEYYEEHPDVAKALVAALVEANHAILTNKEDTLDVLMEWTGIDDPDVAEETYEANLPVIPDDPLVTDESVQFFLERSDSDDVQDMEVTDLVDDSIARELEESGWIEKVME